MADPQFSSHTAGRMGTHLLTHLGGFILREAVYLQDIGAHTLTGSTTKPHGLECVGKDQLLHGRGLCSLRALVRGGICVEKQPRARRGRQGKPRALLVALQTSAAIPQNPKNRAAPRLSDRAPAPPEHRKRHFHQVCACPMSVWHYLQQPRRGSRTEACHSQQPQRVSVQGSRSDSEGRINAAHSHLQVTQPDRHAPADAENERKSVSGEAESR